MYFSKLAAVLAGLFSLAVTAASLSGVDFKDELSVAGKTLQLNGLGKRRVAFFSVYVAGLYLEKKNSDDKAILDSNETKYLRLHFLREASKRRIQDAFKDGLKDNCKDKFDALKSRMDELTEKMFSLSDGDEMLLTFLPDHVDIQVKDNPIVSVKGEDFSKALPALWLGPKPPNVDLKKGLLGLKI